MMPFFPFVLLLVFCLSIPVAGQVPEKNIVQDNVPALIEALASKNADEQQNARKRLVELGKKAVPELIEALAQPKQLNRSAILNVIGNIGADSELAIPLLAQQMGEEKGDELSQVAFTLAKIGPAAVPQLLQLTEHKNDQTRKYALWGISALEGDADKLVPLLSKLLDNDNVLVRRHAIRALFRLANDPVPTAIRAFQDRDAEVREIARNALWNTSKRQDPRLVKAVEPLLKNALPGIRCDALQILAYQRDESMKHGLPLLKDDSDEVRLLALQVVNRATAAIERNPYSVARIVADIAPLLTDANDEVSNTAFVMMRRSGAEGVPYLAKLLDSDNSKVRHKTVETLLYNASKAPALVEMKLLTRIASDANPEVRAGAVHAYASLGSNSLPQIANMIRQTKDHAVRVAAIQSLSQFGESAAFLIPDLLKALKDDQVEVRRASAFVFYWMRNSGKKAIPALTQALSDDDVQTRRQAIYTLSVLAPECESAIIEGIKNDDAKVQEVALHTFWQRGFKNKSALPWLLKALQQRNANQSHHHAIYCLANLGSDAKSAIPLLQKMVNDNYLTIHAEYALNQIQDKKK